MELIFIQLHLFAADDFEKVPQGDNYYRGKLSLASIVVNVYNNSI